LTCKLFRLVRGQNGPYANLPGQDRHVVHPFTSTMAAFYAYPFVTVEALAAKVMLRV
jgi:hypothetical protein